MESTARAVRVGTAVATARPGAGTWVERAGIVLAITALLSALAATWFEVGAGADYPDPPALLAG